ncbi:MAG TPA: hypothetical protein VFZ46_00110, partial [Nitrososphaeraceae archaeon]
MTSIISKTRFEKIYRSEHDSNVKERMLLVLNVVYDKHIPAQVARESSQKQNMGFRLVKEIQRRR